MDRCKCDLRIICDDCFCAVTMMRVEIPDCDALGVMCECVKRRKCNVVEIAKPHCAITPGVMPRRPHETESALADGCGTRCIDRRACRPQRMLVDIWICWRVRIKIMSGCFYHGKMIRRMYAQQFIIRCHTRVP